MWMLESVGPGLEPPALCFQAVWFPTMYLTSLNQYNETIIPTLMQRDTLCAGSWCLQLGFITVLLW